MLFRSQPSWITGVAGAKTGEPKPPVRLQLRAAAVGRPMALSGWDYVTRGPKATRFLAPAGSVYFFDVLDGGDATGLHLASISDDEQDRLDGFGLVLCGEW